MSIAKLCAASSVLAILGLVSCSSDDGGSKSSGTGGSAGSGSASSGGASTGGASTGGASTGGASGGGNGGTGGDIPFDGGDDAPQCTTSTSGSGDSVDKTAICQKVVAAGCPKITQTDCEGVFGGFPTSCAGAWNAFVDCAGATPDWVCEAGEPLPKTCLEIWSACMKPCLPTN